MVICVEANIIQVIVLTPRPNAFLGISSPLVRSILVTEEIGYKLIHPRIGKKQVRRLRE